MTANKHLKRRVRERMARTGESYTVARRHVLAQRPEPEPTSPAPGHLPGLHPETASLRALLTHAGLRDPQGAPLSEALVLLLCGGLGAGAMGFRYEREDFSNFFVAARHLWQDNLAGLRQACERLGLTPRIRETGGAARARADLEAAIAEGPVLAWVDMAPLGYRGFPEVFSGGGYHVLVVHALDGDQAWLGDLADDPIPVPLERLQDARGRIRKDKHRLLTLPGPLPEVDLARSLREGLAAGHAGLAPGKPRTFNLGAFEAWARTLQATSGKEAWRVKFPRGKPLWQVLVSTHQFIEKHHTGGGLLRPLYAQGLHEAAQLLNDPQLIELSEDYDALGGAWTALAGACLPAEVPAMAEARALLVEREQAFLDRGPEGAEDAFATWGRAQELSDAAKQAFPLSEADTEALLEELGARVQGLYEAELAAWERLGAWLEA